MRRRNRREGRSYEIPLRVELNARGGEALKDLRDMVEGQARRRRVTLRRDG